MVRQALDAFIRRDPTHARDVVKNDDCVDQYKGDIIARIVSEISSGATHIDRGLPIIFIAKNLERIADHATNIAEDVIFAASGDDVRHPQLKASADVGK